MGKLLITTGNVLRVGMGRQK